MSVLGITTRDAIAAWFERGHRLGATHMLVVCDSFDHEDYPVYVNPGEDARAKAEAYGRDIQRVMEVYALHLPAGPQFDERRAMHYEVAG